MFDCKKWVVVCAILFSFAAWSQEMPEGRMMRFPDISKDKIAFYYGGDLWLAATSGGVARRITISSRSGTVPQVLAGRKMDRLHRAV